MYLGMTHIFTHIYIHNRSKTANYTETFEKSTLLNSHQNTVGYVLLFLERTTQNFTAAHAEMQKAAARMLSKK